jgi:hypothetical protein
VVLESSNSEIGEESESSIVMRAVMLFASFTMGVVSQDGWSATDGGGKKILNSPGNVK